VIDVGVAEYDHVDILDRQRQRVEIRPLVAATALNLAELEQHLLPAGTNEVARPRDRAGRA
jgi:hypothetical protein